MKTANIPKPKFRLTLNHLFASIIITAIISAATLTEDQIKFFLLPVNLLIFIVYSYFKYSQWRSSWKDFAVKTNLKLELYKLIKIHVVNSCRIKGQYQNRQVLIEQIHRTPTGKAKSYTKFSLSANIPKNYRLVITTKKNNIDFLSIANKQANSDLLEIKVRDEQLNKKMIISGKPKALLDLTAEQKNLIDTLNSLSTNSYSFRIEVNANELTYYEHELITDAEYMAALLNFLAELLDLIENNS